MISLRGVLFNYTVELTQTKTPGGVQLLLMHFPSVADLRLVAHQQQLAEFVQSVQERHQPAVTVHDGRLALRVLDAIARSGRTGQLVRLAQAHR
jgi:predicted dehydrogenase